MKITYHVDPNLSEERVEFWIKKLTPDITNILQKLDNNAESLWCQQGSNLIPIKYDNIYLLEVSNRKTAVFTQDQKLICHDYLSNLKSELPEQFIEASRSAVFNYQYIDHLELLNNGLIDVVLTNELRVQISRRNIKNLKERLGL